MVVVISGCRNNGLSFSVLSDIEYSHFSSLCFDFLRKQTMIIAHIEMINKPIDIQIIVRNLIFHRFLDGDWISNILLDANSFE